MAEIIHRELFDENGEVVGYEYGGRLVRCKDCKHLNKEEMRCFKVEGLGYRNVADKDFRSGGERKEEVEDEKNS